MTLKVFLALLSFIGMMSAVQSGKCPNLPTVANLDLQRYSGHWYSVYESSPPRLPCLNYNLQVNNGNIALTFLPYGLNLTSIPKDAADVSKGFTLKSDVPFLNDANLSVFATDYETYAGIFTCKETFLTHFHSVTFWSRNKTLSPSGEAALKTALDKYNIDYSSLELMEQRPRFCNLTEKAVNDFKAVAATLKSFF